VTLVRIEYGLEAHDEPYEKLDGEIPPGDLEALRSTFVPPERAVLLEAAGRILVFYRALAPGVAEAHGLAYPTELDRLMGPRLERLRDGPG